jgi:hypothetical protein
MWVKLLNLSILTPIKAKCRRTGITPKPALCLYWTVANYDTVLS